MWPGYVNDTRAEDLLHHDYQALISSHKVWDSRFWACCYTAWFQLLKKATIFRGTGNKLWDTFLYYLLMYVVQQLHALQSCLRSWSLWQEMLQRTSPPPPPSSNGGRVWASLIPRLRILCTINLRASFVPVKQSTHILVNIWGLPTDQAVDDEV